MSAERGSLLDEDSDGYGEDSVREMSSFRSGVGMKPYLSPRENKPSLRRHLPDSSQETPIRKLSRAVTNRLTPVNTRLRQCKALLRPLHSRYYPLCIAFYILLATLASCYMFGATPAAVKETVLEPVVMSVGGAVTGMTEKMGDAFVCMRKSVEDVSSSMGERFKDAMANLESAQSEKKNDTERLNRAEDRKKDEEREKRIELITKELSMIWSEISQFKSSHEVQKEWRNELEMRYGELKRAVEGSTELFKERINSIETSLDALAEKVKSAPPLSESPTVPVVDTVAVDALRTELDKTRREMEEMRRLIPKEEEEKWENMASYTHGASIIDSATSFSLYSTFYNIFSKDRAPLFLITERQLFPGDCMPLPATGGTVGIKLSSPAHLSHIEYYHLYWSEAAGIPLSAPKEIKIMGCTDTEASMDCELMAECEYTVESTVGRREEAKRRRIFGIPVECPVKDEMKNLEVRSVRIEVHANHGAEHTCLYLTRVLSKAL